VREREKEAWESISIYDSPCQRSIIISVEGPDWNEKPQDGASTPPQSSSDESPASIQL